ncbi:MAG TPA: hypothetical protein VFS05_08520 [Gemmatimonadaceae bacterium]|nr:hypothetical protein [Gemmatimonadaceae bacterium]
MSAAAGAGGAWLALALLGAFHGLNPAMGWLFAVALGLQQGRRSGVLRALPPIAIGHLLSITVIVAAVAAAQRVVPAAVVRWIGGGALLAFGAWLIVRRGAHPRWVGMRVGFRDLTLWSFLMSSAHGAGLMLVPIVLRLPTSDAATMHHHALASGATMSPAAAAAAIAVHTGAMLVAMTAVALLVYEVLGLDLLRRAWINLDLVWAAALVVAGIVTVVGA